MPDLLALAERLRQTRNAQRRFLALWAVECLLEKSQARYRLQRDLAMCSLESDETSRNDRQTCQNDRLDE